MLPVIPSDTTADNSDSIAANIAIVNAGKIISLIRENEIVGIVKLGRPALIVYKSPIVLTGNLKIATKNVVTSIAIKEPGIFLDTFGQTIWISMASSPRKSFTWPTTIPIAIPSVNPIVIVLGINLIKSPKWNNPIRINITPAIRVATVNPAIPCSAIIPYIITTKAAVGPPIWTLLPPKNEIKKPAIIAV